MKQTIPVTEIPKRNLGNSIYPNGYAYCKGCEKRYYNIPKDQKYCSKCGTQLRRTPKRKKKIQHERI